MKYKAVVDVGCMVRGEFRRFLEKQKFRRESVHIYYREKKGFCESTFLIEVEGKNAEHWIQALRNISTNT